MYKIVIGGLCCCVACQPQEKAEKKAITQAQPAPVRVSTAVLASRVTPVFSTTSHDQFDSLRAFLGVRPMKFRYVVDSVRQGTPTVAGRYIVIHELFQTPQILYRSATDSTRWFQFKLEPIGNIGTDGHDFTVDTVSLDSRRRTLLLSMRGYGSFWGSSATYSQTAIVDVTAEPLLLLKTKVLNEEVSYGRDNDTVYNDDAAGSESQRQAISIRKHLLVIGPPRQTSRQGRTGKLVTSTIRPTPADMLPAGRYRYQHGRMHLVKQ